MEFWEWTMRTGKWIYGGIASVLGLLIPIQALVLCLCISICIDFITGNIADYYRHKRAGERYSFQSEKMWKTGWKLGLSIIGTGFAWMLDVYVLTMFNTLNLANFFTAFVIGTEFWSFLENAAVISDHPIFRALKKYMKKEVENKTNIQFDEGDK